MSSWNLVFSDLDVSPCLRVSVRERLFGCSFGSGFAALCYLSNELLPAWYSLPFAFLGRGFFFMTSKRIGIFGGAFDPPHLGHVLGAVWAQAVAPLDAIWVVPVAQAHPWGKEPCPFPFRLELCRAAFADLPFVQVSDAESRNPTGFTVDLLRLLRQEHPSTRWSLIVGTDQAQAFDGWREPQAIKDMADLIVLPRGGQATGPAIPAISSTLIRERLAKGLSIRDLVPQKVAQLLTPGSV